MISHDAKNLLQHVIEPLFDLRGFIREGYPEESIVPTRREQEVLDTWAMIKVVNGIHKTSCGFPTDISLNSAEPDFKSVTEVTFAWNSSDKKLLGARYLLCYLCDILELSYHFFFS